MAASATAGAAPVAHHFDNLRQQQATVRFGMWLFLATEVLFFGGAMVAYTVYRIWFPRDFEYGSALLNVGIASVNTFLLLTSSLTVTLAIRAVYRGSQSGARWWLLATIVLGLAFLGLKMREYQLDYLEGLIPGSKATVSGNLPYSEYQLPEHRGPLAPGFESSARRGMEEAEKYTHADFTNAGISLARVQLFFMFYYILTGLHVLHMVVGIGLLVWQYILAWRGFFAYPGRYVYVEVMSLYWHFVDMVWIFLLPLLYLAGPHTLAQAVDQFKLALGMAGH